MAKERIAAALLSLAAVLLPAAVRADVLSNFTAIYQVERDSTLLGRARFTLSPQGTDCYLYHGTVRPEGLAALLAGETVEQSHFCIVGGKIRPLSYKTLEEGGKGDNYVLNFDWVNRVVRSDDGASRKLLADGVDPLSLQIALRKQLSDAGGSLPTRPISLVVVEEDKEKDYSFRVTGREALDTPLGRLEAIRLDRTDDSRKQLRLWLAPSLDYLPVRVERQRGKGAVMRLKIETLPDSPVD
ncbi:MAG TPA: DUF3108 domain-containing protein [Nevskiales bacterium]|nr:DUF3108 domain-containing protein [Nevskiales bacterium]